MLLSKEPNLLLTKKCLAAEMNNKLLNHLTFLRNKKEILVVLHNAINILGINSLTLSLLI